jgi:hypothetical protein
MNDAAALRGGSLVKNGGVTKLAVPRRVIRAKMKTERSRP